MFRRAGGTLSRIGKNPAQDEVRTSSWGLWGPGMSASPDQRVLDQIERIHPIVYRCLHVKASDAAQPPLRLYFRERDGKRSVVEDHPLLRTHAWINGIDTPYEWRQSLFLDTEIEGNHFSWVEDGPLGPARLLRLPPEEIECIPDDRRIIGAYERTLQDGSKRRYDPEQIWHFKVPNRQNRLRGFGAVHRLRDTVAIDQQMSRWRFNFFYNDLPVDILFRTSKGMDKGKLARARHELEQALNGRENQGRRFAILDVDTWEVQIIPRPKGDEANYIEGRKFEHATICCVLGVPPNKVMDFSESGGLSTNAEQQERLYWEDTILSMHRMFLERLNKLNVRYMGEKAALRYEWDFDYSKIKALNASEEMKSRVLVEQVTAGITTRNEARRDLGRDDFKSEFADELMIGNEVLGEKPEPLALPAPLPEPPAKDAGLERKVLQLEWIHKDIDGIFDSEHEMALLRDRAENEVRRMMELAGALQVELAGLSGAFNMADPWVFQAIRRHGFRITQDAVQRTHEFVRIAIARSRAEQLPTNSAELRAMIDAAFDERRKRWQIRRIARTEVHSVQEEASYLAARQAGIENKQWVTAHDDKVRAGDETGDAANHKALETAGPIPFELTWKDPKSGAELKYPGDMDGANVSGVDTINCRCTWVAYFADAEKRIGSEVGIYKQVSHPVPLKDVWEAKSAQRKRFENALAKIVAAHILGMQRRALARFDRLAEDGRAY